MWAFALGIVLGCGGGPMDQMLPTMRSRSGLRAIDTLGAPLVVHGTTAAAWEALPDVFTSLGLDINFRNPAEKRVGTCFQRLHGRLGKAPLSNYLDCGEIVSLPNADTYQVEVTVLTTVSADSGGTTISTFVLGVGQSNTSSARIWCRSKGTLEDRIRAAIESKVSK